MDQNGNIVNNYAYDEWGNILTKQEQVTNPLRYAGEYYDDESGLYYLRSRYYDPTIGRFISRDSYEGDITNPLSLNLYTYVENDPLSYVDPSGHSLIGAVIGIGIGVAIGISTGSSRNKGGSSYSGSNSSGGSSSGGSSSVSNSLDFIGSFINLFSGKYSDQFTNLKYTRVAMTTPILDNPNLRKKYLDPEVLQGARGNDPYGKGVQMETLYYLEMLHYNRNKLNNPPYSEQDAIRVKWIKLPKSKSVLHQIGEGNESNVKYISPNGKMEAIYNSQGNLVIDPVNKGTYNFASPSDPSNHFYYDMLPYYVLGNEPEDTTTFGDRIRATGQVVPALFK
ncbi:RHS repeat-associated core domain-containing protein [Desulforamulus aeronauticus]|uniref:RHS repeat-associated core domain-containing protein n=1 Tax=Desulforamulus aeronauticus DSM 10349 TaxID=1121421 RepID=A0A1M6XEA3_9FIRM|nr:RHS repeat-associated core domain-containing protein [Desulforamulus aeronauticus DSM 10349]